MPFNNLENWKEDLEAAFKRFELKIYPVDQYDFRTATLGDVKKAAREVESHLAARKSLRNLKRIQPFLDGLERYSKVIEVLCQGTPYLSFIWVRNANANLYLKVPESY